MSRRWLETRERSNIFAVRVLVWIALFLGRRVARGVLALVAFYFLLFGSAARAASRSYLSRVMKRRVTLRDVFLHFYTFATVALDRVYFLSDRWSMFDIHLYGEDVLIEQFELNKGCYLLGAHIGSFECLRTLGRRRAMTVNLVMFEENANRVARVARAINPDLEHDVIALGTPESMLRVIEQLDKGAWVGMLGDRAISDSGMVEVPFLDGTALFPAAPFRIAALTGRSVILMLGLYRGKNRYDLHFEMLAEQLRIDRSQRQHQLRVVIQNFSDRLAALLRVAPYNWFNFYDFWKEPATDVGHVDAGGDCSRARG